MQGSLHASIVQLYVYVHIHRCDVIIDKIRSCSGKKNSWLLVYTATTVHVGMTNNEGPKEQNSVNHCQR